LTKSIKTLIDDIYSLIRSKHEGWFDDELARSFSNEVTTRLAGQLGAGPRTASLRLSKMGPSCQKALWASVNCPEVAEALPPWAEVKYSFGHIIEALAISLARAAGHQVDGEQDELKLDGIVGHRDCVIDGCVVDVKSSSSIAFQKFKGGDFSKSDNFGYLDQLDGYVLASVDDPLVKVKDRGYLLAVDKQLGHMCLYEHEVTDERARALKARIAEYKHIVAQPVPPACTCGTEEQAGNTRLDLRASYSPYKHFCFPYLRTFLYSGGPVYFTNVTRRPFNKDGPITEIDKNGKVVYN
jgi:hypothetical protein